MTGQEHHKQVEGNVAVCTQCNTPAFVNYGGQPMCVQHHLMIQQASWIQFAQHAALINEYKSQIAQGTGYLLPPNYMKIPPPPSLGDNLTFNNIRVTNSSVGVINTGTIKRIENLDASVTVFRSRGQKGLAESLQDFTQSLLDSEVGQATKEEIAQQVEYLVAQAQADPGQRSMAIAQSVLRGIKESVSMVRPLNEAWAKLQPLLEDAIRILS